MEANESHDKTPVFVNVDTGEKVYAKKNSEIIDGREEASFEVFYKSGKGLKTNITQIIVNGDPRLTRSIEDEQLLEDSLEEYLQMKPENRDWNLPR
jgi:hypothetical protein